jgi:hypothetical protein
MSALVVPWSQRGQYGLGRLRFQEGRGEGRGTRMAPGLDCASNRNVLLLERKMWEKFRCSVKGKVGKKNATPSQGGSGEGER